MKYNLHQKPYHGDPHVMNESKINQHHSKQSPRGPRGALPYRLNVGMLLCNRDRMFFVGRRKSRRYPHFQLPQGGIEPNETVEEAAFREIYEEVGVRSCNYIATTPHYVRYRTRRILNFNGRAYQGQQQTWVALLFEGEDTEINLSVPGQLQEFSSWTWASADDICAQAPDFKRESYLYAFKTLLPEIDLCLEKKS